MLGSGLRLGSCNRLTRGGLDLERGKGLADCARGFSVEESCPIYGLLSADCSRGYVGRHARVCPGTCSRPRKHLRLKHVVWLLGRRTVWLCRYRAVGLWSSGDVGLWGCGEGAGLYKGWVTLRMQGCTKSRVTIGLGQACHLLKVRHWDFNQVPLHGQGQSQSSAPRLGVNRL